MKKHLFSLFLVFVVVSGFSADFETAEKAYKAGDYITAVTELRPLAEKGDERAQFSLGMMYAKGEGVTADMAEAYYWVSKAEKGMRFETDKERVRASLKKIKSRITPEQLSLAEAKLSGNRPAPKVLSNDEEFELCMVDLEAKNFSDAISKLSKLGDKGHIKSILKLGEMYLAGEGTEKDAEEAMKWFQKGAEKEDPASIYKIGLLHSSGQGAPQDDIEALKWILKAAELDYAPAQNTLAEYYMTGKGLDQNFGEAYFWTCLSAQQGNEEAEGRMNSLNQSIPPENIAQIKERVKEWKPKKP